MSLTTFTAGAQVTLLKRQKTGSDTFGNDVFSLVPTGSPMLGAFAPGGSAEIVNGRDTVVTQPTVYLTEVVDLAAIDALDVDGKTWEVDGDPLVWGPSPFTGHTGGTQIPLRKVTG
jgi:hypothetical protein